MQDTSLLASCYCKKCKQPIPSCRVIDHKVAFCPKCQTIVDTSLFQVKGWVIAVTVFLYANLLLVIWL